MLITCFLQEFPPEIALKSNGITHLSLVMPYYNKRGAFSPLIF